MILLRLLMVADPGAVFKEQRVAPQALTVDLYME
jgi:hypothetical protein